MTIETFLNSLAYIRQDFKADWKENTKEDWKVDWEIIPDGGTSSDFAFTGPDFSYSPDTNFEF
jgi:hypothetical protein